MLKLLHHNYNLWVKNEYLFAKIGADTAKHVEHVPHASRKKAKTERKKEMLMKVRV